MNRKKKWYLIDRPDESAKYLQGWAIAGRHLQALFNQYNQKLSNPYTGFCWLRTQITSPTFDSMNFRFKNNVFSVQVDFGIDKNTRRGAFVSEKRKDLQVRICENNDMIPCLFRISGDDMTPMESGWNLRHTKTGEKIVPLDISDDSFKRVSRWELLHWGIAIVMDNLRKKGYKVLSFTDAPDVMPQLWFEDHSGNKCWVQVIVNKPMSIADFSGTFPEEHMGYLAGVTISPVEGEDVLYRSHPAEIEYKGLKKIC